MLMPPEKVVFTSVPQQLSAPCSLPLQQGVSPGLQLRMCNHYNIGKTQPSENQIAMFDFQLVTHSLQTMNSLLAPMSCFSRHNSQIQVLTSMSYSINLSYHVLEHPPNLEDITDQALHSYQLELYRGNQLLLLPLDLLLLDLDLLSPLHHLEGEHDKNVHQPHQTTFQVHQTSLTCIWISSCLILCWILAACSS